MKKNIYFKNKKNEFDVVFEYSYATVTQKKILNISYYGDFTVSLKLRRKPENLLPTH